MEFNYSSHPLSEIFMAFHTKIWVLPETCFEMYSSIQSIRPPFTPVDDDSPGEKLQMEIRENNVMINERFFEPNGRG